MASVADIRPEIAAKINAAIDDVQCDGYVLSSPTSPFFDVELDPALGIEPNLSMGGPSGITKFTFLIRACVISLDRAQQMRLDEWTATSGATSVRQILEADQTLNGVADGVVVVRVGGYRGIAVKNQPGNEYLGAEWTVEITTQG